MSINQFLLDYFQLQLHTRTSRQCCCIAGKMNFSEDKKPQLPLTSFSVVSVHVHAFVFFLISEAENEDVDFSNYQIFLSPIMQENCSRDMGEQSSCTFL